MKQEKLSPEQIRGLLAHYCPHYYSNEHVDEILNGTSKQLIKLFQKTTLSCIEQIALIEKAPSEVIEAYIKQSNHLYADAQIALVKRGDEKLIDCFMINSYSGFVSEAKTEMVINFRNYSKKWWKDYFRHFSEVYTAELALINTHDISFLKLYLDEQRLSTDACIRLLNTYEYDEIRGLINYPAFCFTSEAEAYFVKEMSDLLVEEYLVKHDLYEEGQIALVERGCHSLIMKYLEKHTFTNDAIIKLVERGDYDEISMIMEKCKEFPCKAEAIIAIGLSDKLFDLLNTKGALSLYAECELAKSGIKPQGHNRIMKYLKKRAIKDADAIDVIMNRGNSEEIKACIRRKCLNENAQKLLIKRGMRDEIELFISVYRRKWKISE